MVLRDLLRLVRAHYALVVEIQLIPHEHLGDVGVRVLVDTVHPGLDVLEALGVGQVERDDHAVGLAVELVRDRLETLLPRRVPDLHVEHLLALLVLRLDEVDSYVAITQCYYYPEF